MNKSLVLLAMVAQIAFAHAAPSGAANRLRPSGQSGIMVHVWYPAYCEFIPGLPPWCRLRQPYNGTFSIYTYSGQYVTSAATYNIAGSFTVFLKPGRYVIIPDDPELSDEAITVKVLGKRFTDIFIELDWNEP